MSDFRSHHVGLTVSDLAAQKAWYHAAFGFVTQLDFELPGGVRGTMLRTEGGAGIELFEVPGTEPGLSHADPPSAMRRTGYGHVGLETDDLDVAFGTAVAAGATAVWEPRTSPEPGKRMAFVHDPEGNLVELIGPER